MLDVFRDPRGVPSTQQWSRPETNVSSQTTCRHAVRIAVAVCCAEVLFQPSFFWCCSHVACGRRDIQRVGCGGGWDRSTLRVTGRDTAQTERMLMRLVDTSSLDSRLHHSGKKVFARHPCIEPVVSCCLCQCCTHDSSFFLSPHFAHGSGAPGYAVLIHGSALCRQLKSCLLDWSNSRKKPCRQDNDKVQRNRLWQRPPRR